MKNVDLASVDQVDLASIELSYEAFRSLACNPHLSPNERIGFPNSYREGFEPKILADILSKLPGLNSSAKEVLDIGPGCSALPRLLIDLCESRNHRLHLIDSLEMLSQLPDRPQVVRYEGPFPQCMARQPLEFMKFDVILCYSVLHYMFVDTNLFSVVDATVSALAPGGCALFGDIPNVSKRRRFFASESGKAYHRAFTGTDTAPSLALFDNATGKIDDSVLQAMVSRAHNAGCDAYILPQSDTLPMANRRDDLLICRP